MNMVVKAFKFLSSLMLISSVLVAGCGNVVEQSNTQNAATEEFQIASQHSVLPIYVSDQTDPLIVWAANALARDISAMTGMTPTVNKVDVFTDAPGIYIGEFNDPVVMKASFPQAETDNALAGKWESFSVTAANKQLRLTGSDVRGTVYAIFDIAERMGVSPWQWWADVAIPRKETITLKLTNSPTISSPSVKFRGIFLNDEDWGLQPWAAKTFEPETNDIGPKTYEKIFQLMLRLKANTIWPAMHPSTQAFYRIPGNQLMAQKYHIYVGSSHAEPMARNNVDEWDKKQFGEYNYVTNKDAVIDYWESRVEELSDPANKNIFTLGMRGVHDSKMEGVSSTEEGVAMLEGIIDAQRNMLSKHIDAPLESIPQAFIPYKEVLKLYNHDLKVPDDVTLMWTDDNYGYIRRLSDEKEQKRQGGSGVYYHLSYWGRPHDYLWLSSMSPSLVWFEMTRAYQNGAQNIWIANVGDIKPSEYLMEFFLDLAWDINAIDNTNISAHLEAWASREFGDNLGKQVADIMQTYYDLAHVRKPEFMGWSQTERTTPTYLTEFSKPEAEQRLAAYKTLVEQVNGLKPLVSQDSYDAWFQLVEYPVKAAAEMNAKFLNRDLYAYALEQNNEQAKQTFKRASQQAFDNIVRLTSTYNEEISGGKWRHMMSMNPRGLPVYQAPDFDVPAKRLADDCDMDDVIYLQASQYASKTAVKPYDWAPVEGLGASKNALTLMPFNNTYFLSDKPSVSYPVNIETAGEYIVEVRTLPTHANDFDHGLSVSVNGKHIADESLNTVGRSTEWKLGVLRNAQIKQIPVNLNKAENLVSLAVNQPGIVIDQIAIYPSGSKSCYLIPAS